MATHISKKEAREADLLKVKNERTGEILKVVSPHDLVVGIADFMESDLRVLGDSHINGSLYVKNGASGTLVLPNGQYAIRAGASIQVVDDGDGGFTINSLAPGSVASAPKDAPYIAYASSPDLTNEKVLNASGPITFDSATATIGFDPTSALTVGSLSAGSITVGGISFNSIPFITTVASPSFPGSKLLTAGGGISVSAAGTSATVSVDSTVARISGAAFTGIVSAPSISSNNHAATNSLITSLAAGTIGAASVTATSANISSIVSQKLTGSLTKLSTGADYLRAGNNISISTGSDGSVTISAPTVTGAPLDARYLVVGPGGNASLSQERVISFGAGIAATDGGAGGSYTLSVLDSQVAFLTGAAFSGPLTASSLLSAGAISAVGHISASSFSASGRVSAGSLTGSLTKLATGADYLRAGRNVILSTGSDGSVTIAAETGSFMAGPFLTHHPDANFPGSLALIEGDGIQFDEDVACGNFTISAKLGAGPGIVLTRKPTREIVISSNVGDTLLSSSFILASGSAGLPGGRTLSSSLGLKIMDGGGGGKFDLRVDPLQVAYLSGSTFTGAVKAVAGLTGSITRLIDGSSYIRGGTGILVTSGADGSITITNDGTVGDITAVHAGAGLSGGGISGSVTLAADPLQVAFLTGSTFTGATRFQSGISGSLTRLFDGSDYLRAGTGISLLTGSDGSITITNNGAVGDITAVNAGLGLLGGGTSGSVSLSVDPTAVAFLTGAGFTGRVSFASGIDSSGHSTFSSATFSSGLSGSLTHLPDGTSYLIAGSNIEISTGSTGAVTISSKTTFQSLTGTSGVSVVVNGTSATASADPEVVAFLTGASFTGAVSFSEATTFNSLATFNGGLSGSLTSLPDGTPYLRPGSGVTISTGSGGWVTISATGGGPASVSVSGRDRETLYVSTDAPAGDVLEFPSLDFSSVSWSSDFIEIYLNGQLQHSASYEDVTSGLGDYYLTGTSGVVFGFDLQADDTVDAITQGGDSAPASTISEPFITFATASNLLNNRIVTAGSGVGITLGSHAPGGGLLTIDVLDSQVAFLTGSTFTGVVSSLSGFSGSLTSLADGSSYIRAGAGIMVTTGADGSITITNDGTVGDITAVHAGMGLAGGGVSGSVTLYADPLQIAYLSGSAFTGEVSFLGGLVANSPAVFNQGLTGSLTKLATGGDYIRGGEGISVSTGSDGSITVEAILDAPFLTYSTSSLENGRVARAGAGIIIDTSRPDEVRFSIDPSIGGGAAYVSRLALNESPSGVIDGVNRIFTLGHSPSDPSQLMLWLNGQLLTCGAGYDFTASSNTIMFAADATPQPDDTISTMYPYIEASERYILNERVDMSTVSGVITGQLQNNPLAPARLMLYWNGQLLSQGADKDYVISGRTIYINPDLEELEPDDIFIAMYMAYSGTAYYEINEQITISYDPLLGLWKGELSHDPVNDAYPMIFMNGQLLKGGVSEDFITSGNRVVMLDDEIGGDFRFYATYEYLV